MITLFSKIFTIIASKSAHITSNINIQYRYVVGFVATTDNNISQVIRKMAEKGHKSSQKLFLNNIFMTEKVSSEEKIVIVSQW